MNVKHTVLFLFVLLFGVFLIGSDGYNMKLSQRRAESVKKYLVEKFGIAESRISAVGYGESMPVAPNDTAEGRQKNRRVVAIIEATVTTM